MAWLADGWSQLGISAVAVIDELLFGTCRRDSALRCQHSTCRGSGSEGSTSKQKRTVRVENKRGSSSESNPKNSLFLKTEGASVTSVPKDRLMQGQFHF